MKIFLWRIFLVAVLGVVPASFAESVTTHSTRLTEVDSFSENDRPMMIRIATAVRSQGINPHEYFAVLQSRSDGEVIVLLVHESHPSDDHQWRGDACGKCRVVSFDAKKNEVKYVHGIR